MQVPQKMELLYLKFLGNLVPHCYKWGGPLHFHLVSPNSTHHMYCIWIVPRAWFIDNANAGVGITFIFIFRSLLFKFHGVIYFFFIWAIPACQNSFFVMSSSFQCYNFLFYNLLLAVEYKQFSSNCLEISHYTVMHRDW